MDCIECQFENPTGTKFCINCGVSLHHSCTRCGGENPAQFKFCGECGYPFTSRPSLSHEPLSFDQLFTKVQSFLPEGLAYKILSQRDRIEGELKNVTVMFCDMQDFTPLSERLGPEGIYVLMGQIYEILIRKVNQYEGTVNEMTGDGIMALFGAPIALEDGPQRSIQSGLAIQEEMARFSKQASKDFGDLTIRMRIGINSGTVVVGTLGNDLRVDFKAIGDTVNLAARVQKLAEPGMVYVTENTFRLTEGLFQFEALGEKSIKGKRARTPVYRVIAPHSGRSRFDVSAERGLTPFVGRHEESAQLLAAFHRAKAAKGQVLSIIGAAGIGKSRFLHEFRKKVADTGVHFLEGRCLSYSKNFSYHPVAALLKNAFGIKEADSSSRIREKVKRALWVLQVDVDASMPYLLNVLSVGDSGIDAIAMSPEERKERVAMAVKELIIKGSRTRPLVIVIEDLHWADAASLETIERLAGAVSKERVLIVVTARPEFSYDWKGRPFQNKVSLKQLSDEESHAMVAHLLGVDELDLSLQRLVLGKTEGVPFFVEEFVRALKNLNIIEKRGRRAHLCCDIRSINIPATIHDMIMAKVDQLPNAVKTVLLVAATIDRAFSFTLLHRSCGVRKAELRASLKRLIASELICKCDFLPRHTYAFRHAMTRDVVYASILSKTRMRLHESIGDAIEYLYADKLEKWYGALVNHFSVAGNHAKAATYCRLACLKADNAMLLNDAVVFARRWINALEKLPSSSTVRHGLFKARATLGFLQFRMSNIAEAKDSIDLIADASMPDALRVEQGQVWVIIGSYKYMVEEDFVQSIRYLENAIRLTEKSGDIIASAYAQYAIGLVSAFNCDFKKAIHFFEKLLDLSESLAVRWQTSVLKSNLSIYGYNYHGLVAEGYRASSEALRIAEESGDIYSKAMAYPSHGVSCYYKGFLEKAMDHLRAGAEYAGKIKMAAYIALVHQYLGHVYVEFGDYHRAVTHYEKTIRIREESRLFPSSIHLNRIALARAKCLSGERIADVDRLCRYADLNRVRIYEGSIARYIAEILLLDPGHTPSSAEPWIVRAIQADAQNAMHCDMGWNHVLYGRYFIKANRTDEAKQCLEKAFGVFERCGADGWIPILKKRYAAVSAY